MIEIDLENWKRKEHFDFFSQFDEPFFGIVSKIDCTTAYNVAKAQNSSFFAYYLHKSLTAANQIPEFRHRINDDKVILFDAIHASPTIARADDTFAFSFMEFTPRFKSFHNTFSKEYQAVQNSSGLRLTENAKRIDTIHYSSIPWCTFTGLTHARNFKINDSAPKISFGKIFTRAEKRMMAVSVNVHHGLVDGLHVGQFFETFQKLMNVPVSQK